MQPPFRRTVVFLGPFFGFHVSFREGILSKERAVRGLCQVLGWHRVQRHISRFWMQNGSPNPNPKALRAHNISFFGPKDHTIVGFWAILSLRVNLILNPKPKLRWLLWELGPQYFLIRRLVSGACGAQVSLASTFDRV